ncbi:hypothetical protein BDB01DRAFT_794602 [Pilobolus umbonatus]|nr:hypothetical protein BDB01DRAFT_794602 [Pilobolus umbonatus]
MEVLEVNKESIAGPSSVIPNAVSGQGKRLTHRSYFRFCLHKRLNEFSILFYARRLFKQYVVGAI